jgi:alanyl-tRNA synthetase
MGTPTAYDCCFGPITEKLIQDAGIDADSSVLVPYFTEIAKNLELYNDLSQVRKNTIKSTGLSDEQISRIITPLEGIYLIIDHIRTLIFAISDGALPSNVGGGYNLRMMLRRIISTMDRLKLKFDLDEIIDIQIDYLKNTYPELEKTRQDVKEIISIETGRYDSSKQRMQKIVSKLDKQPNVEDLIRLYESDGVTPEYLKEMKIISEIPSTFYGKLAELHQSKKQREQESFPLEGIPDTELLFYGDDPREFDAKVLKSFENFVVLDRTAFYARGGGQEPDHGTIGECEIVDITKHGNVVVHKIKGDMPKDGETVSCIVDAKRRDGITKNHTSTHIINTSARSVLGSWVWQHSAFKEEDHARLDITHHSALTDDDVEKIEQAANSIVEKSIPVKIENFDRGAAEQKYGFRIYQGGVVPVKSVRIVSIGDLDIEACGGTHVANTSDVEEIKITRTKRIQDGVVRIEFVSGESAKEFVRKKHQDSENREKEEKLKEQEKEKRVERRQLAKERIPIIAKSLSECKEGISTIEDIIIELTESGKANFCYSTSNDYDDVFHIGLGEVLCKADPRLVYCGLFEEGEKIRVIVYAGDEISKEKSAGEIVRSISQILGGAGGGSSKFAQGGGTDKSKKEDAIKNAKTVILG